MNNGNYTFEDKHGKCLCPGGMDETEVVTTETREGPGLWVRCKECGLVLNQTGVPKEEVNDYYNNESYRHYNSYQKGGVITPREHYNLAIHSMRPVAEHMKQYLQPTWRVMDIGAATGGFLHLIKDKVDYCMGVELNQEYCKFMKSELGLHTSSEDYFSINHNGEFDLIVINGTLDHMYNSLGVLDKIYQDLKQGGMFYIQTANDNQVLKELLPENSRASFKRFMYQRAHYLSFTEDTLIDALQKAGFVIIDLHSRHDYTFNNFLNWYYTGSSQNDFSSAKIDNLFFSNDEGFPQEMNRLMIETEKKFHKLLAKYKAGELLCVTAIKE